MPDYAPNYTARLRVAYTAVGKNHHMTWRLAPDTGPADLAVAADKVVAFFDALSTQVWGDTVITGWSYQLADGAFFLPYGGPAWADGGVSASGRSPSQAALALGFIGRSIGGLRGGFFLYGVAINPVTLATASDFRLHSSEAAYISTAVAVLADTPPPLVANDGNDMIWYEYANVKYNDYWVRKSR